MQMSDTAKPEVSDEEPDEDVLDRPVAELESGPSFPVRPLLAPSDLPVGQPIPPPLFASAFFPYVPVGVPIPSGVCRNDDGIVSKHCPPKPLHKPPAPPEHSTLALIGSALTLILCRYRRIVR